MPNTHFAWLQMNALKYALHLYFGQPPGFAGIWFPPQMLDHRSTPTKVYSLRVGSSLQCFVFGETLKQTIGKTIFNNKYSVFDSNLRNVNRFTETPGKRTELIPKATQCSLIGCKSF